MKVIGVIVILVAAASAAPQQGRDAQILRFENENIGIDGYKFSYETSDPITRQETGELTNAGSENEAIIVKGEYSYVGPDGKTHSVSFVADENGYRPSAKTARK
ncbi:endocuticle structural glycoprotein SgAbd-5-like [Tribolium madens]|uniref:endocuticle structural glycoprotein SgAbd-5-like n=1 Tax=Tribolium madens TaxID=41895 RepID=UPI001CF75589|nr:endocuticle structural glycoprotein SgAbd-5-like [Tribolium madens]